MSLQRGSYGIEFDERPGLPTGKLWGLAALILALVSGLFFYRGCGADTAETRTSDEAVGQTRYRLPEAESERERPSLWEHFKKARQSAAAQSADKKAAQKSEGGGSGQFVTQGKRNPVAKVQSPEVRKLLDQAAEHESADDLVNARLVLQQILLRPDAEEVRAFVERKIGTINSTLVFGDRAMPEKVKVRIAAGDLVSKLAKKHGCTQEYLLKANGIDKPELLRIGRELWVLQNPAFEVTVYKQASSAVVTLNGEFFKRYDIGMCKPENAPSGTYAIRSRAKYPASHTQNIYGTRWIALSATGNTPDVRGLGLHGTWNDALLGRPADEGRIRFRNADIEELCTLLPDGTPVNIAD